MTREARKQFERWVDTLLSPGSSDSERAAAVRGWHAWAMAVLDGPANGVGAEEYAALDSATRFSTGRAIGPLEAARCVWDYKRTVAFLRAVDRALADALERFPGETVHLVEAGCGPLAPLALPFAVRYPASRVQVTVIDAHGVSLAGVRRLAAELGVEASMRNYVCADAAAYRFAGDERPHVIACEVLQRALADEPQVAVTLNLAPQLRDGGFFVPARIEVRLGLFNAAERFGAARGNGAEREAPTKGVRELGRVFCQEARAVPAKQEGPERIAANTLEIPRHHPRREPLHFLTRIELHGEHRLEDFDCALNVPEPLVYPAELAERGGRIAFEYRLSETPGLHAEFAIASAEESGSMRLSC